MASIFFTRSAFRRRRPAWGLLLWIALDIIYEAWPAVATRGLSLLTSSEWNPNRQTYGIFGYLLGTIVSSLLAMLIRAALRGVHRPLFERGFYARPAAPRFPLSGRAPRRHPTASSTGCGASPSSSRWSRPTALIWRKPSAPRSRFSPGPVYGNCMLTASPSSSPSWCCRPSTAISRNALQSVPQPLREGGLRPSGSPAGKPSAKSCCPPPRPPSSPSAVLALGRAMGETMAMAMLIGNSSHLSPSLLSPAGTLAGLLAQSIRRGPTA